MMWNEVKLMYYVLLNLFRQKIKEYFIFPKEIFYIRRKKIVLFIFNLQSDLK